MSPTTTSEACATATSDRRGRRAAPFRVRLLAALAVCAAALVASPAAALAATTVTSANASRRIAEGARRAAAPMPSERNEAESTKGERMAASAGAIAQL